MKSCLDALQLGRAFETIVSKLNAEEKELILKMWDLVAEDAFSAGYDYGWRASKLGKWNKEEMYKDFKKEKPI